MPTPNSYTHALTELQASKLRELLQERGWKFEEKPYTLFAARKDKTTVAVYEKGPKILVQGKGLEDFVTFLLEPEILGVAELGYEEVLYPEMYEPHIGIDESGKGDFFGPLVIAGVYVDPDIARALIAAGIADSKAISSDQRIRDLAETIRSTPGVEWDVVSIGPQRYNEVYGKAKNLNRLLAWGHARVLENLLEKKPDCPRALSDKFAHEPVLQRALLPRGRAIQLDQRTKGESDPAVAAASILARERFINWLDDAGERLGVKFPRGSSSPLVEKLAKDLVAAKTDAILPQIAKMHFKTAYRVLGLPIPKKPGEEENNED